MTATELIKKCDENGISLFVRPTETIGYRASDPKLITEKLVAVLDQFADRLIPLLPREEIRLSIFEDAELFAPLIHWEDRDWCESRIGNEVVMIISDQSSIGSVADEKVTYRLCEIAAMKRAGIVEDGPKLHSYHAHRTALVRVWEKRNQYRRTGWQSESGPLTWKALVRSAAYRLPSIEQRAERVLEILIDSGLVEEFRHYAGGEHEVSSVRWKTDFERLNGTSLFAVAGKTMESDGDDPFG